VQYGEKSGVGISTTGLGGKPSENLALRRLASAVVKTALHDLMDEDEQHSATQFFYSGELELWCGILKLDVGCVREALEELGVLRRYVELVPEMVPSDMMQHYLITCEDVSDSNLEILLEMSYRLNMPYALVHFYIYDQILPWKHLHVRRELGKNFFKEWNKHKASQKGRGTSSRFGKILDDFRKRLAEGNCG
jgi:hypothetical protein